MTAPAPCLALLCSAAALVALTSGCATPAGQLPETEFAWSRVTLPMPPSQAFRHTTERARRCGDYRPDGQYYPDAEMNRLDLYLPGGYGSRSNFVLGVVEIRAGGEGGADVRVGVQHVYDRPLFGRPGIKRQTIVDAMRDPTLPCDYMPKLAG